MNSSSELKIGQSDDFQNVVNMIEAIAISSHTTYCLSEEHSLTKKKTIVNYSLLK